VVQDHLDNHSMIYQVQIHSILVLNPNKNILHDEVMNLCNLYYIWQTTMLLTAKTAHGVRIAKCEQEINKILQATDPERLNEITLGLLYGILSSEPEVASKFSIDTALRNQNYTHACCKLLANWSS